MMNSFGAILLDEQMSPNGRAHLQPGLVFIIVNPRPSTLTGCQVERGLDGIDKNDL